jgi:hypothetical protein
MYTFWHEPRIFALLRHIGDFTRLSEYHKNQEALAQLLLDLQTQ